MTKICQTSLELRNLRYFVAAAEHGSFRKAGIALGIQQSAISRRVRDLEDRLGASLFQRHCGGVCLTFAGERFLVSARNALSAINEGAKELAAIGQSDAGRIGIGLFSSLSSSFLSGLIETFELKHPAICFDFTEGDQAGHISAVEQLRLDVAFVTGLPERPNCETEPLWTERIYVALPSAHRLAAKDELDWSDFADERFVVSEAAPGQEIHDLLIRRLAGLGRHPEIQLHRIGRYNLMSLVGLGRGLTVTSEATISTSFSGVVYRPIRNELLPFSAVWSPDNDNPACRRFLSLARLMARKPDQRPTNQRRGSERVNASTEQRLDL